MSEEKIIDKIRKLMNLANSGNENEAQLAAARATELMLKHEIDQAKIAASDPEAAEELGEVEKESIDETGAIVPWKGTLAGGLAQSQGCEMYYGSSYKTGKRHRTYVIIGQESKRQTIKYMYNYLVKTLMELADVEFRKAILKYREEKREYEASGLEMGPPPSARAWKNSFRLGCASRIWGRLNEQRKETHKAAEEAGQTQALVVVASNEEAVQVWMKANVGPLGKGRSASHSSGTGYCAGREAGKSVGLGGGGKALGRGRAKQLGSGS